MLQGCVLFSFFFLSFFVFRKLGICCDLLWNCMLIPLSMLSLFTLKFTAAINLVVFTSIGYSSWDFPVVPFITFPFYFWTKIESFVCFPFIYYMCAWAHEHTHRARTHTHTHICMNTCIHMQVYAQEQMFKFIHILQCIHVLSLQIRLTFSIFKIDLK